MKPMHFALATVLGVMMTVWGSVWLGDVGDLERRTGQTLAVVDQGRLRFTASDGASVTTQLETDCRRRVRSPGRGCAAYFEDGDEVLISYDTADPQNIWYGSTPGGFLAAVLLYGGITFAVAGGLALWFVSPWYNRIHEFGLRTRTQSNRTNNN